MTIGFVPFMYAGTGRHRYTFGFEGSFLNEAMSVFTSAAKSDILAMFTALESFVPSLITTMSGW